MRLVRWGNGAFVPRVAEGFPMPRLAALGLVALLLAGCDTPARPAVSGRYWAHLWGHGAAPADGLAWFEYKPRTAGSWAEREASPARAIEAGEHLDAFDDWVSGLRPGTDYDYRLCRQEGTHVPDCGEVRSFATAAGSGLAWVVVDPQSPRHLKLQTGERFSPWGNNYVFVTGTGQANALVEHQMTSDEGMALIDADLQRLANLAPPDGASNVIRMHLQLHTFLRDAATPDREALAHYSQVIEHAEDHGLRVMVTGLNYFFPADNPPWVAAQTDEAAHWATQAVWWNAMAQAVRHSPGVFSFDLMNEPYPTGGQVGADGLARYSTVAPDAYCSYGEDPAHGVHGTCFGQYVTASPGTRPAADVAAAWTQQLVQAIRTAEAKAPEVPRHLVTIGVGAFGLNNSFNSSTRVHEHLDFLSPHLYPEGDGAQTTIDLAAGIAALTTKPIIAGETFTFGPVDRLIANTCNAGTVQGWIGQYDGRVLGDVCPPSGSWLGCALYDAWYQLQSDWGPTMRAGSCPPAIP